MADDIKKYIKLFENEDLNDSGIKKLLNNLKQKLMPSSRLATKFPPFLFYIKYKILNNIVSEGYNYEYVYTFPRSRAETFERILESYGFKKKVVNDTITMYYVDCIVYKQNSVDMDNIPKEFSVSTLFLTLDKTKNERNEDLIISLEHKSDITDENTIMELQKMYVKSAKKLFKDAKKYSSVPMSVTKHSFSQSLD